MFFRWDGNGAGTKSAMDDGRNWKDASGSAYAQAVYPGQTAGRLDDVVFDTAVPTAPAGYTFAEKLNSIRVGAGFVSSADGSALDIGSSGTYVKCDCSEVIIEASGNVYLEGDSGGLDRVQVVSVEDGKKVFLKGVFSLYADDDAVEIGASSTVNALSIGGIASALPDITILTGVTLPSTVQCRAGNVSCQSAVTTLEVMGGTWDQDAGNITTLRTYSGTLNWNAGNITTIDAKGGSVLCSGATVNRRVTNITAYDGATVDLRDGLGNVRVTGYIDNQGGTVLVDDGISLEQYLAPTYAGASDAKLGVSPQSVAAAASVYGDDVYVGIYDRLEVLIGVGATDATTVTAELQQSSDATHGDEAAITDPAALEWEGTDDDQTKKLTLWGYQITNGKTSIRLKISVTGGTAALVAAMYQVYRD